MSDTRDRPAFIDRPAARLAALGVMLAALSALAWIHRGDLFPGAMDSAPASPQEQAFRECFEPRAAQLDKSLASGELKAEQVAMFRNSAEAICRDRAARSR